MQGPNIATKALVVYRYGIQKDALPYRMSRFEISDIRELRDRGQCMFKYKA